MNWKVLLTFKCELLRMAYWDHIKHFGRFPESLSFSVIWVYWVMNLIFFKKGVCAWLSAMLYIYLHVYHIVCFSSRDHFGVNKGKCCLFTVLFVYAFHSFAVVEARPGTFTQTHTQACARTHAHGPNIFVTVRIVLSILQVSCNGRRSLCR